MKVLLIYPSQINEIYWGSVRPYRSPHVSLWNHLRRRGHDADFVDLDVEAGRAAYAAPASVETFRKKTREALARRPFDVVGISCWTSLNYLASLEVARLCREANPGCRILVGGYHVKAVPQDFLGPDSPFDDVVSGDGEDVLARVCDGALPRPASPTLVHGEPHPLDGDPAVDWEAFPYKSFITDRLAFLTFSRGCPMGCSFCIDASSRWRVHAPENALAIVRRLRETLGPRVIEIQDPLFGLNKDWRRGFLEGLAKQKKRNWEMYWMQMRADVIEKEDLALLSKINCKVQLGVETGSAEMLKTMNKTADPAFYLRRCRGIAEEAARRGVLIHFSLMHNFPGETERTNRESLDYFRGLLPAAGTTTILSQPYAFFPGSDVHDDPAYLEKKFGARFLHPRWWAEKDAADSMNVRARRVIPSRGLEDESHRARWSAQWQDLGAEFLGQLRDRKIDYLLHHRISQEGPFSLIRDLTGGVKKPRARTAELLPLFAE